MSAPNNAITVEEEAKTQWEEPKHKILEEPVECHCGWTGQLRDLLCDPNDPNPPVNDFWCPRCLSKGWFWS